MINILTKFIKNNLEMGKKSKEKGKSKGRNVNRVTGNSVVPFTTSTSNVGAFVLDTYDIDSTLLSSVNSLASVYEKWRVISLRFTYCPNISSTSTGTVYMACTDDPDESSPTTDATIMNLRVAGAGVIWKGFSIYYKPIRSLPWLYTKDQVTSDDRLEMPGVFLLATSSASATISPGRVIVKYTVEFTGIANTTVSASMPIPREIKNKEASNHPQSLVVGGVTYIIK